VVKLRKSDSKAVSACDFRNETVLTTRQMIIWVRMKTKTIP